MASSKSYLALVFVALAVFFLAATTSAQNSQEGSDTRIRDLLIEKRDVLADHLTHAESQFKLESLALLNAKLRLLDAELALADSAAERIKVLKDRLDIHRAKESRSLELYKTGNVTFGENIDAIVQRIDAAIALSRETGNN